MQILQTKPVKIYQGFIFEIFLHLGKYFSIEVFFLFSMEVVNNWKTSIWQ